MVKVKDYQSKRRLFHFQAITIYKDGTLGQRINKKLSLSLLRGVTGTLVRKYGRRLWLHLVIAITLASGKSVKVE